MSRLGREGAIQGYEKMECRDSKVSALLMLTNFKLSKREEKQH